MKKHEHMNRAELIRRIKALEKGAPAVSIAFEHERMVHELQVHQVELETQNRELREAQLLLKGSRDRYADFYDFAPVGYATFDDKGIIREINLTAAGMLGAERTRLVGAPFNLHVALEDLARFREHLAKHTNPGERVTTELHLIRKGHCELPVMMQSVIVTGSGTNGWLCRAALTDITERQKAEEALREANEFGKQVFDGAEAGIIVYDRERRFLVWNPFMEQLSGYRAEEVLGRTTLEVFPFLREQGFEEMFQRALAGEIFEGADTPFDVPEKGKKGWKVERFSPWRDSRKEIVGVIVAVRDITERKRLENEILEISEREQRKFGRDVHDGLGQRLTGLEMLSHGLVQDLERHAPALVRNAERLNRELRETVTQARLISHSLAPVPLEGDGLMRGLMELAASTNRIPVVSCRFFCNPPVEIQDVTTATHLYRIAQEAVNNALKHGRAKKIDITLEEQTNGVALTVNNNGRIMPKDNHASVGTGLNAMRYRAEMIGGRLAIASGKRKGVTVTCTLPRKS